MPEISAAELRKLRSLETRVTTVNETLGEVRAKRKEAQAELTAARRELRQAKRDEASLSKQVEALIEENARLAGEVNDLRSDLGVVTEEAERLRTSSSSMRDELATSATEVTAARKARDAAERARARIEKQLATVNEKIEGTEPPELTPDQLSSLLGGFIDAVGGRTRLDVASSSVNLRVGFSGRGGGAFVVPSLGVDASKLPELHDVTLNLERRPSARDVDLGEPG